MEHIIDELKQQGYSSNVANPQLQTTMRYFGDFDATLAPQIVLALAHAKREGWLNSVCEQGICSFLQNPTIGMLESALAHKKAEQHTNLQSFDTRLSHVEHALMDHLCKKRGFVTIKLHRGSPRTDGTIIFLPSTLEAQNLYEARLVCFTYLLHEIGHISDGSFEPIALTPSLKKALRELGATLPSHDRELLHFAEILSFLPDEQRQPCLRWFNAIEDGRINARISAKGFGRFCNVLDFLVDRLLLETHFPSNAQQAIFHSIVLSCVGHEVPLSLQALLSYLDEPLRTVWSKAKRLLLKKPTSNADALLVALKLFHVLAPILESISVWTQHEGFQFPTGTDLSIEYKRVFRPDPQKQTGKQGSSTDEGTGSIPSNYISADSAEEDDSLDRPERLPGRGEAFHEFNHKLNRYEEDVAFVDLQPWVPMFDPVEPAPIPQLYVPQHTQRLQPTKRSASRGTFLDLTHTQRWIAQEHHGTSKQGAANPDLFKVKPQQTKTYSKTVAVVDVTTSMCAHRENSVYVPLEVAMGMLLTLQKVQYVDRVYASIEAGRRWIRLLDLGNEIQKTIQLHEVGLGGFRLGALIRFFGKHHPEGVNLIVFSDSSAGHYLRNGSEQQEIGRGVIPVWNDHCKSCSSRKACCIDPVQSASGMRTQSGLPLWKGMDYAKSDIKRSLTENPHVSVIYGCLEVQDEHGLANLNDLGTIHNFRWFPLYGTTPRYIEPFFAQLAEQSRNCSG